MNIKNIFIALVFTFAMVGTAYAGDVTSGSNASNTTNTSSQAGAINGGLQNEQNFYSPDGVKYSGEYTVKSAPGFSLGSFGNSFSSDYCSGTSQAAISGPGFGIGGGKQVLDEGCQLLRASDMTMRISAVKRATATTMWNIYLNLNNSLIQAKQAPVRPTSKATIDSTGKVIPANAPDTSELQAQVDLFRSESFQKSLEADELEQASVNNVCSISKKIRKNMVNAGVDCKD